MNACEILLLRPHVTGAARRRDIRSVDAALGIGVAQDLVRSMTTGTRCRDKKPILAQGEAVN